MSFDKRFDRRRFLQGAAGATLAIPFLPSVAPREARAAAAVAPTRLLVFWHPHGRVVGENHTEDVWSPRKDTGPLPADLGTLLRHLNPIKDEIVTIDHIDNRVRHGTNYTDAHTGASVTNLTCRPFNTACGGAFGPSFDFVAGQNLKPPGSSMWESVVIPGQIDGNQTYENYIFQSAGGSPARFTSPHPKDTMSALFAGVTPPQTPMLTLRERLQKRRTSVLDGVLSNFNGVRDRANAADKQRLDEHATLIREVEQRFSQGATATPAPGCAPPDAATIPPYMQGGLSTYSRGQQDGITAPLQLDNIVQAFLCDVTRVAAIRFWLTDSPVFRSELPVSPFFSANWHDAVHGPSPHLDSVITAFGFYARMFTLLIQKLAAAVDVDGSRVLDNTLVVWTSDLGYGATHYTYDVPIVMAGLKRAFPKGQGRHVAGEPRSLGDLYAHVLTMLGASTASTFGAVGRIGDLQCATNNVDSLNTWAGRPNGTFWDTPLHSGRLDL